MKIGFLSLLNPNDVNQWSGTLYFMFNTLKRDHQVEWIGGDLTDRARGYIHRLSGLNVAQFNYEESAEKFGAILSARIEQEGYDVVLVFEKFFGAYLETTTPVVFLGDTTFAQFKHYLTTAPDTFLNLSEVLDRKMLDKADMIIYSSEWAKSSAVDEYGLSPEKIAVVEFGANLPEVPVHIPTDAEDDECRILFIGKRWKKKGGDKLYQAYKILQSEGYMCSLTIVGSTPDVFDSEDANLTVIPYIDKSDTAGLEQMRSIMERSHILVLPTLFDCYGIVFCEASAYGIPSIASDVGGVHQVVKEGANGYLLPSDASAGQYAELIRSVYDDKASYLALRQSSRREFEQRLNWTVWLEKVNILLSGLVKDLAAHPKQKESDSFYISTYIINLPERVERRAHMEEQFKGRDEFGLIWVEACRHTLGTVGLWQSIRKAIGMAVENDDDVIVLCEDDHYFTEHYSRDILMQQVMEAHRQGAQLLIGGIGGFGAAFPVAPSRYWIDWYWSNQFLIIYKSAYQIILDYQFKDKDTADGVLSELFPNKMAIHPFISRQKNFGYSDVTLINQKNPHYIENYFNLSDARLEKIRRAYDCFYPQDLY